MAHYAKIVEGLVTDVIVADYDFIQEQEGTWVQTDPNTFGGKHYNPKTGEEDTGVALRKNYAGLGYTYDSDLDAFYSPKPFDSWVLNTESCLWEAPIAKPEGSHRWDEDAYQADNTTGWVEVTYD